MAIVNGHHSKQSPVTLYWVKRVDLQWNSWQRKRQCETAALKHVTDFRQCRSAGDKTAADGLSLINQMSW